MKDTEITQLQWSKLIEAHIPEEKKISGDIIILAPIVAPWEVRLRNL